MKDELKQDVENVVSEEEKTEDVVKTEENAGFALLHAPSEEEEPKAELLSAPKEEESATAVADTKELSQDIDENKVFQKFKIKDIVFIAIMSACMLLTGGVMPLVINVPVFGIIHLALGLQCSLFPTIAMLKVKKTGTLFFMSLFFGIPLVMFQPIMCVGCIVCALLTEVITVAIFRGYNKEGASVFAGTTFFPLSLPLIYLWYKFAYEITDETGEAVRAYIGASAGAAIGISIAVVAICFVGSLLGAIIVRELRKAGVIKK